MKQTAATAVKAGLTQDVTLPNTGACIAVLRDISNKVYCTTAISGDIQRAVQSVKQHGL